MNEYESALYRGGVLPGMVPGFAQMLAHTTVTGIRVACTELGGSIVVYFMCKKVKPLFALGQMIVSGFMHAVFAVAIESLARTTVDVYVRRDEFNFRLLCLSSPQDKGLSFSRLTAVSDFYRTVAMHPRSCHERLSVCPSVRLSVKSVNCDKTKHISVQVLKPYERPMQLVFRYDTRNFERN